MGARAVKKESQGKKAHRTKLAPPSRTMPVAELETRLEAMRDGEARIQRVEALEALVNTERYQLDSRALAEKMVNTPSMLRLLGLDPALVDETPAQDEAH